MFKVLIAEDEPPIMRMIKSTLESVDSDFCVNPVNQRFYEQRNQ